MYVLSFSMQPLFIRPICRSSDPGIDQPSEWFSVHRDCTHKDRVLRVRSLRLMFCVDGLNKAASYGPRQVKNSPYNEVGRLHVDAKFAPFSCARRRAPLRVSMQVCTGLNKFTFLFRSGSRGPVYQYAHTPGSSPVPQAGASAQVMYRCLHHHTRERRDRGMRRLRVCCSQRCSRRCWY